MQSKKPLESEQMANITVYLKTLENKNKDKRYVCEHIFPELTALCPTTKQPYFYTVRLLYEPSEKLVELKSFKLYL